MFLNEEVVDLRASQIDPDDDEAVADMMEMAEDESITWEEE